LNLESFLILSAILFCIGLTGVLIKSNIIAILMSLELMLNSVNIAAVAASRYVTPINADPAFVLWGNFFAIFIITIAAAEVALGLAIVMSLYKSKNKIFIDKISDLKG
jgi:NAD(P)H-quinone oxidoreductase subunit 4L|tara:strand:+ start:492 stop:815 length:324 start_codon:yes stop_codon:yes gene_type:complete